MSEVINADEVEPCQNAEQQENSHGKSSDVVAGFLENLDSSPNQERLADLERKLANKLIITEHTGRESPAPSNMLVPYTVTLEEFDAQEPQTIDLLSSGELTPSLQNRLNSAEIENVQLKTTVTELEKQLKTMESMCVKNQVTLASITRVNIHSENSKVTEGLGQKYKTLKDRYTKTKAALEQQKDALEENVTRLEIELKKALASNIEIQNELELSRHSVVVLTDKLTASETNLENGTQVNALLEQQLRSSKGEIDALMQQLEMHKTNEHLFSQKIAEYEKTVRQDDLKTKEISNLSCQLEATKVKLRAAEHKFNAMEKRLMNQGQVPISDVEVELKMTKDKLHKAEAALDLMFEKYKNRENHGSDRLKSQLVKLTGKYEYASKKTKHLKGKLLKKNKSLEDLKIKWDGMTSYFRSLEEKSAKGELLTREDFDTVLNYLISCSLLNEQEADNNSKHKDLKRRDPENQSLLTSEDWEKEIETTEKSQLENNLAAEEASQNSLPSKDIMDRVVRDFREVAITNKTIPTKNAAGTCSEKGDKSTSQNKQSEPDVIVIDSENDTPPDKPAFKKNNRPGIAPTNRSSWNGRPRKINARPYYPNPSSKKKCSPYFKPNNRKPSSTTKFWRSRSYRSLSRSRSESRCSWSSCSRSRDNSPVSSCSSCFTRGWRYCTKLHREHISRSKNWKRSRSSSYDSGRERSRGRARSHSRLSRSKSRSCSRGRDSHPTRSKRGRGTASRSPGYQKYSSTRVRSPSRKSYRRRSRSISVVRVKSTRSNKFTQNTSFDANKRSAELVKKSLVENNLQGGKESTAVSRRKELLEDILKQRLQDVEKEEGECSETEVATANETNETECREDDNGLTINLLSPDNSTEVYVSDSEWDFLFMSPAKESYNVSQGFINMPVVKHSELNKTKRVPQLLNKNGLHNNLQPSYARPKNLPALPPCASNGFDFSIPPVSEPPFLQSRPQVEIEVVASRSAPTVAFPGRGRVGNQKGPADHFVPASTGSKIVRKKTRNRRPPFQRPMSVSATIPLKINVENNETNNRDLMDSITQKYTVSITKEIPGYNDKHPVDFLNEVCNDKQWAAPEYQYEAETNTVKRELFYFCDVLVNGVLYQPKLGGRNKKDAQTLSAMYCLQQLGKLG